MRCNMIIDTRTVNQIICSSNRALFQYIFINLLFLFTIRHFFCLIWHSIRTIRYFLHSIWHYFCFIWHFIVTIWHFINSIQHFNGVIEVIEVNSAVNFATNKLRLLQSGSFYFIYNSRNAASSMLDQIHVSKRIGWIILSITLN